MVSDVMVVGRPRTISSAIGLNITLRWCFLVAMRNYFQSTGVTGIIKGMGGSFGEGSRDATLN